MFCVSSVLVCLEQPCVYSYQDVCHISGGYAHVDKNTELF